MAAVITSPTEHVGTAPGLSVVEKNQVSSVTKSAGPTWVRTFLSMVSCCSHIKAHWPSCLSASLSFYLAASSWNWSINLSISFSALAQILPISLLWAAISSSSFASCLCCLQSSSYSRWDFTQATTCGCLRAIIKSSLSSVCEPLSLLVLVMWLGLRTAVRAAPGMIDGAPQ